MMKSEEIAMTKAELLEYKKTLLNKLTNTGEN